MRVGETAADKRKNELFQCFRRGWKHGACANAVDKRFTAHTREDVRIAYDRGHQAGRDASLLAAAHECDRLDYDPRFSMLRAIPAEDPPALRTTAASPKEPGTP